MGSTAHNVLGGPLQACCFNPTTGFFRDGYCHTDQRDSGRHVICARMTREFLEYGQARGNDLVFPRPKHGFPGLKPGDRWCLCARRWLQALEDGCAPPVVLAATHEKALELVALEVLAAHALDRQ